MDHGLNRRGLMGFFKDVQTLKELGSNLDGLRDEFKYLSEHNFFEEFEKLINTTGKMLKIMEALNSNIGGLNKNIEKMVENVEVVGELKERVSVKGIIISTFQDLFSLLNHIVRIALIKNVRKLRFIEKSKKKKQQSEKKRS